MLTPPRIAIAAIAVLYSRAFAIKSMTNPVVTWPYEPVVLLSYLIGYLITIIKDRRSIPRSECEEQPL